MTLLGFSSRWMKKEIKRKGKDMTAPRDGGGPMKGGGWLPEALVGSLAGGLRPQWETDR